MTRLDPSAPENAHSGPQERPEGGGGTRATSEGANGPQTGADGLDGGQAPRGPIYWARQQQAEREGTNTHDKDAELRHANEQIARVRVLHHRDGDYCAICTTDFGRLSAPWPCPTIRALDDPPTHDAGPTVHECADNDRRWWADKYAGEQP